MKITRQKRSDRVICKCIHCVKTFSTKDALAAHLSGEFEDLTTSIERVIDQMKELNVKP